MKFEIRKTTLDQAIHAPQEALLVLWPEAATGAGTLADWVSDAQGRGDFKHTAGSILQSYGMTGFKARRVVVVSCGEGHAEDQKMAVSAAWASLKGAKIQSLGLHWSGELPPTQVQHAAVALAEASYAYTTTLSKPKPPHSLG